MVRVDRGYFFKIDTKLLEEFKKITEIENVSTSQVVRDLIKKYVEQNKLKGEIEDEFSK